jgi:hypothetical protein
MRRNKDVFPCQRVMPPVWVGNLVEVHERGGRETGGRRDVAGASKHPHILMNPRPLVNLDPSQLRQTVFSLLSVLLVHASPYPFHAKPCPLNFRMLPIPTRHHKPGPKPSGALPPPILCIQQTGKGL